ncbi:MAG: hydrogenase maturation protease [Planctomycetota bacterium]
MTRAVVVGVGQASRGDDGVGLAVIEELRARGAVPGVRLEIIAEPSALIDILGDGRARQVVVVDALVGGGRPGEVRRLEADDLEGAGARPLSSHGVSVAQAIGLARVLSGPAAAAVVLVGIVIPPPGPMGPGLTPAVAEAVPRAADEALALCKTD